VAGFSDVYKSELVKKASAFFDVWTVVLAATAAVSFLAVLLSDQSTQVSREGKILGALWLSVLALTVSAAWCLYHVRLFLQTGVFDWYTKGKHLRVIGGFLVLTATGLVIAETAISRLGNLP